LNVDKLYDKFQVDLGVATILDSIVTCMDTVARRVTEFINKTMKDKPGTLFEILLKFVDASLKSSNLELVGKLQPVAGAL